MNTYEGKNFNKVKERDSVGLKKEFLIYMLRLMV